MKLSISSQIVFLYYKDLEEAHSFLEGTLRLTKAEDQGWAKIYQTSSTSYIGIVDEKVGSLKVRDENAVLVTLVVDDVDAWYQHLVGSGVKMLTEIKLHEEIQVRGFFIEGPGGYVFEFQEFLNPQVRKVFHN